MSVELLEDAFPHGTVQGHEAGCRGRICPGREAYGWSCAEAVVRFRGDWGFRKRVMAGMSAADIAAEEAAVREEERRVAKAARRAERAAGRRTEVTGERLGREVRRSRRWTDSELAELRRLHGEGMSDAAIGRELNRDVRSVFAKRKYQLELPAVPGSGVRKYEISHGTRGGYDKGCRDECPESPSCADVAREYWRVKSEEGRRRRGAKPRQFVLVAS